MEGLLSTEEAAERLGVAGSRIRQLIAEGRLPAKKIGGGYVILSKDLDLVKNRKPGRPKKKAATRKKKL